MGLTGLIFGIPVFFDIGIFVLAPLVYVAAKQGGRSLLLYALPMLAGLSMTHAFLPPHPGPVAASGLLGVSLGWLILMGLICGIPAWLVSGVWWGSFIGNRIQVDVPDEFIAAELEASRDGSVSRRRPRAARPAPGGTATAVRTRPPSVALIATVIAVPMLLILSATFGSIVLAPGNLQSVVFFLGTPAIALTVAVLLAMYLLGIRRGMTVGELARITGESLKPIGMILLVVGAGAFFGAVLQATGVGKALAGSMSAIGLPVIVSAYVISAALRLAQGSATVAIVTTAGIIAAPGRRGGLLPGPARAHRHRRLGGLDHREPRQRRRLLDRREVLQHVGEGHAQDLDRARDDPVGRRVPHGGPRLAGRLNGARSIRAIVSRCPELSPWRHWVLVCGVTSTQPMPARCISGGGRRSCRDNPVERR